MKPWEKYAEAEAKPWEKYATAPLSVKADPIGEQADRDYDAVLGRIGVIDRGATFGLGRKVGGLINAIGSYPIDRIAQLSGVENTPGFWDRYHEVVDPTMQAMDRYQEERPVEAFALEMAGGIANPANKVGAGWIGKGGNAATRVLRSGVVGTGAGGVAGAMNTENVDNLRDNTIVGSVFGGALGVTLPVAIGAITKGVGLLRSNTKKGLDYMRRELGDEAVNAMIREAEETGRPIIEVANDKALKLGQAARMQTPEAMDTIDAAAERFKNTMSDRNSAFIDDNLGSLSRFDSLEAVENEARQAAKPYYDKLQNIGDLAPTKEQLAKQNFNRWFEGSKVVDENGQPLTLYHGTRADFDTFDLGKSGQSNGGISKIGVWLTPEEQIAKEFSNTWYGGDNPRVMQTYVNMKNPKVYKSVDNTKALKKIESDIDNVNNKMQKINDKLSNSELSQLRGFMQYDDYDEIAKMYGYSPETAKNAKDYWNLDKQLDDLLFEQRNLKANDAYDQLLNDLDEHSEFVMHRDGVKDFRRGSHTSRIAIKNPDEAVAKLKDRLKKEGYDGIVVENTNRDTDVIGKNASQYVAFEPNQIKSVNNSGAWSSSPSLSDAGWNPKTNDALANYVKENPFLQQEIGKIRKNPLFQTEYNMSELPDTDWRILDQLNKNINDQISTAVRNGENETVRLLERQKYDLLNKVDEIVPEYKQARALYEDARRFKKAANTAEQIFKGDVSKEAFAKTFDSMSKTERDALKIGLRDEIYKIIGNRENEALGWKKVVPAQVQDKIRKVLGVEEGNKLIKYANDEIKAMRNYNKATQGSKTAEKTDLEKAINWRRELLDFASLGSVRGRNKGIANIMTNPNAGEVASAFDQLSNPKWGEAVYQRYLGYTPEMIALGNYLANKR